MSRQPEWRGPRRMWDRSQDTSKREQGVATPQRPLSRRQRAAAVRIDDKAQTATRTEEAMGWLKQQMGLT